MELVYFSNQTMPKSNTGTRSRTPRITFGKGGLITISQSASELMGLKSGGKVSLAQDQKAPENWYLFLDTNGFEVRGRYKNKGYVFNHKELVKSFLIAFEKDVDKTHSFLIGGQPTVMKGSKTQYWGILVR